MAAGALAHCGGAVPEPRPADILARIEVPNRVIPQAEVRLVRCGEEMIVRSVILPSFPGRVCRKIINSERDNWGDHPDAIAYITTLTEAFETYGRLYDMKTTALVIDFVYSPDGPRVDFSFAAAIRGKTGLSHGTGTIWKTLHPSTDYLNRNQEYILIDAFGKQAATYIGTLQAWRNTPHGKTIDAS